MNELTNPVTDLRLRDQLRAAVGKVKDPDELGIVFKHHIPENNRDRASVQRLQRELGIEQAVNRAPLQ